MLDAYPWVFRRAGRTLDPAEPVVTLLAVGDVMPGRDVRLATALVDAPWLSEADLTLGNLEAMLPGVAAPRAGAPARAGAGGAPIILQAPVTAAPLLAWAGFDVLGVANNHALDFGPVGLAQTVARLQGAGLAVIGGAAASGAAASGAGAADAASPLVREVNGVRLAFLAFNLVPDPDPGAACAAVDPCRPRPAAWEPATGAAAIAAARAQADAVIVSVHWGFEYEPQPDPGQEEAARAMLAAGADVVLGHHPHVVQSLAVEPAGLVAYSLGNFLFDQAGAETERGLALRLYFDRQGLRAAQALPLRAGRRPRLLAPQDAPWLAAVLPSPPRVGFTCSRDACTPAQLPPAPAPGRFVTGQADLTGDGAPEMVRLAGARITIYEAGEPVWRSPAAWQVVDAALGDPNDDGRYELMLALWRQDEAGHRRSQPYIIGYRRGIYDLLWGGRAVADPIQELAVGDVDGDGGDELVVIEAAADGAARYVTVWRWAGWTFSLVWRSQPGAYADLAMPGHGGAAAGSAFSVAILPDLPQ